MRVRILIAAGGSGGHIFPAIAIKRALDAKGGCDVMFVGSDKSIDRRIFEKEGSKFALLSSNKLQYKRSPYMIVFLLRLFLDTLKSLWITARYKPASCVGFGGYVSFPVILSAKILRVPTTVHEQNVVPGRANRVLFRIADKVAVSFEDTLSRLSPREKAKAVITGNPIRTEDFKMEGALSARKFGLDPAKFTILVVGGSQGAHVLNEKFISSVGGMGRDYKTAVQVIHLTGIKDYEWAVAEYGKINGLESRVYSFIDKIEDAYNAADLIVTRAGASALFEAAYFGKAMIVVPYPYADSHQVENARAFLAKNAAIVIEEKDLTDMYFRGEIERFLKDRPALSRLGLSAKLLSLPGASAALAETVLGSGK